MSVAISIRLPDELAEHLKGIAKETDRPRSYIIQKAIEVYLEDYSDLQVALDRLRTSRRRYHQQRAEKIAWPIESFTRNRSTGI